MPHVFDRFVDLEPGGQHRWRPIAPFASIEVNFQNPALKWSGTAYFDMNIGQEPLETAFERWDWSRAETDDGGAIILYDVTPRESPRNCIAHRFRPDGHVEPFAPPAAVRLGTTKWGIKRASHSEDHTATKVVRTLEDTPFYARSLLQTVLDGQRATAVHESLDLNRFRRNWVQMLLPFRMPRRFT